jgi:hypothetical protein
MRRRFIKPGKPLHCKPTPHDLIRFLKKIKIGPAPTLPNVKGPCWLWTGKLDENGYAGQFWLKGKAVWATRFAFQAFKRLFVPGEEADHLCHNRQCVNPDHLVANGKSDNSAGKPPRKRGVFVAVEGLTKNEQRALRRRFKRAARKMVAARQLASEVPF